MTAPAWNRLVALSQASDTLFQCNAGVQQCVFTGHADRGFVGNGRAIPGAAEAALRGRDEVRRGLVHRLVLREHSRAGEEVAWEKGNAGKERHEQKTSTTKKYSNDTNHADATRAAQG